TRLSSRCRKESMSKLSAPTSRFSSIKLRLRLQASIANRWVRLLRTCEVFVALILIKGKACDTPTRCSSSSRAKLENRNGKEDKSADQASSSSENSEQDFGLRRAPAIGDLPESGSY